MIDKWWDPILNPDNYEEPKMNKEITRHQMIQIAIDYDIPVAALLALAEVESNGYGFLKDGRPKLLFESRYFHNLTNGIYDKSHPNLSTPKWVRNYIGGAKEYDRLNAAIALNETAALQSASWGKMQIMGANYKVCGYDTVQNFVLDMYIDEKHNVDACMKFCESKGILKYLRALDFEHVALLYNGAGYRANLYDEKLEASYNKFIKK